MSASSPALVEATADWQLLRVYAWYRLLLASALLGIFALKLDSPVIGAHDRELFLVTGVGYFATAVSTLVFLRWQRKQIPMQSLLLLLLDILVLTLLVHASGGLSASTQLAMLFLVTVAAGNILLSGRLGTLVAAVAAIAILYEQFYFTLSYSSAYMLDALADVGILGISFFAVALFSQMIANRTRRGEALAAKRAADVQSLQRLNEQIIRRMRTGIIVVDSERHVLLSNDATRQLLGLADSIPRGTPLNEVSLTLQANLYAWQQNPVLRPIPFRNTEESAEISAKFARLNPQNPNSHIMLIFLEDTAQFIQQAQHLKLASLGRLTASIAHEIRNPLGAISHATQLLAESDAFMGPDRRLLEIIDQHCRRMNSIVENVLSVSRRQPSYPEVLELAEWLNRFREEYLALPGAEPVDIVLVISRQMMPARFDPQQLYQVLTNLVVNGLRYNRKTTGEARVRIEAGLLDVGQQPYVDVIDEGPGIPPQQLAHLFEPFYTTEATGTGLGLYLSREICEANQARLDYIPRHPGACFRITFAHPERLH
ncbi:MAG: ATP-binding protein [Moraxellaceae bacterium]|nr:ATP-binding protein [Moraxellaceae bacterium]